MFANRLTVSYEVKQLLIGSDFIILGEKKLQLKSEKNIQVRLCISG